jgi:hypothetical protein
MKHYSTFPQHQTHRSLGKRWFWFQDTTTLKDLVVVQGVEDYKTATKLFRHLVGPQDLEVNGHHRFEGLHVAMGAKSDESIFKGSIIFLAGKSLSVLAHELIHAVSRNQNWMGIKDEEALACMHSAWMEIIQAKFKWKG